jgi:transcriptional regulator of acetoin/glycerol metabolism
LEPDDEAIDWEHLPDDLLLALKPQTAAPRSGSLGDATDIPADLRTLSRQTIERTVTECEGNLSEAARVLGISRNTLYRRRRD